MKRKKINLSEDFSVPEIVSRKCSEAYEIIYKECEQKNTYIKESKAVSEVNEIVFENCDYENKSKNRITLRKCAAIAACAAVFAAVTIPAVNKHISPVKNMFSMVSDNNSNTAELEMENIPTQSQYAVPDNKSSKNELAEIEMENVYCDGSNLTFSLILTPEKEQFRDITSISAKCVITTDNDKNIYNQNVEYEIYFRAGNDGNFYSVYNAPDYYSIDIKNDSELKVHIYDLEGINEYVQTWSGDDGVYMPERTGILKGDFEFERIIKTDTSNNATYIWNETKDWNEKQGGITLSRIRVTPFDTSVNLSGDYIKSVTVNDQDGNELGLSSMEEGEWKFSTPLKTATILNVAVNRINAYGMESSCSFQVPVKRGFAENYPVVYELDESKIIYNPPVEEQVEGLVMPYEEDMQ